MKQPLRERLRRQLFYGGLSREQYHDILPRMREQNQQSLWRVSLLCFVALIALSVSSLFIPTMSKNRDLYLITTLIIGLFCLTVRLLRGSPRAALPLWYVFLAAAFGFGIVLGTVAPVNQGHPATSFCVLLFALPLLVVDSVWRMALILLASSAVFCFTSAAFKAADIATMDRVNCISFCLISLFVNNITSINNTRQIADRMFIERERDTDGLTRLLTKSASQMLINSYLAGSVSGALFVIDLDNFKKLNDARGHGFGDRALLLVSRCLHETFRRTDVVGRFGGDEFIAYMLHADSCLADAKAREFMATLAGEEIEGVRITCSVGIAVQDGSSESYSDLFNRADKALYASKEAGRNRYTVSRFSDVFLKDSD